MVSYRVCSMFEASRTKFASYSYSSVSNFFTIFIFTRAHKTHGHSTDQRPVIGYGPTKWMDEIFYDYVFSCTWPNHGAFSSSGMVNVGKCQEKRRDEKKNKNLFVCIRCKILFMIFPIGDYVV